MLEKKLPDNVDDLIALYVRTISEYGYKHKETKVLYKKIMKHDPSMKSHLKSINKIKKTYEKYWKN